MNVQCYHRNATHGRDFVTFGLCSSAYRISGSDFKVYQLERSPIVTKLRDWLSSFRLVDQVQLNFDPFAKREYELYALWSRNIQHFVRTYNRLVAMTRLCETARTQFDVGALGVACSRRIGKSSELRIVAVEYCPAKPSARRFHARVLVCLPVYC